VEPLSEMYLKKEIFKDGKSQISGTVLGKLRVTRKISSEITK
jgi:hypothetical protein